MTASRTALSPDQLTRPTQYGYRRSAVSNWCQLIPGDSVVLTGPGRHERYAGQVDAVSADGALVWLVLDNGGERRLFHRVDGHSVLLDPRPSDAPITSMGVLR
jgi:hypothetical protein